MFRYRVLQLTFLVSSMASPALIKGMVDEKKDIGEGIAQRIEELPKELRYKIFPLALALRENPKYEIYKKFDVGSQATGVALNAYNTRALTGSDDNVARIWDIESGTVLKELKGHKNSIVSVGLSADGTLALTGSFDGTAIVWNVNTGEHKTLKVGYPIFSVALSADGNIVAIATSRRTVLLYNTSTGKLLKELEGHECNISSVALSADGTTAVTSSPDRTARVWDINTGQSIILRSNYLITSVALSADGTIALTATDYNKVLVWDAKSGALLNTLLTRGFSFVGSVALSKDGKRALVGTHDNKIQVWNTKPLPEKKVTEKPLTELEGHTAPVTGLVFGDDDFIASVSKDNTALIWKPFALEPQDPQENKEIFRQAYKETFSRPLLRPTNGS